MNKETKLFTSIIITFIFSIQLVIDKSFQPIFPNINEENNKNNNFSNLEIIEKIVDKEEIKSEGEFVGEEQVPIKPSESNNNNNNKNDGKMPIKNEIEERNTNVKIINSNMNQNQSKESILKIQ